MLKNCSILLLIIFWGCSKPSGKVVLRTAYCFLLTNGDVHTMKQVNDTLVETSCYLNKDCQDTTASHHRILAVRQSGSFTYLELEWLDTIPLKEQFCPGKRFSIQVFKIPDTNKIQDVYRYSCLTRSEMDTLRIDTMKLNQQNSITYYSDPYMGRLRLLQTITSADDIRKIINAIDGNVFDARKISYTAEQLNNACIAKGYNPLGAGKIIDSFFSERARSLH